MFCSTANLNPGSELKGTFGKIKFIKVSSWQLQRCQVLLENFVWVNKQEYREAGRKNYFKKANLNKTIYYISIFK